MATLRKYAILAVLFIVLGCAFSRPVSESSRHNIEEDTSHLQEAVDDLQDRGSLPDDVYVSRAVIPTEGEAMDSEENENTRGDMNAGHEDHRGADEVILRRVRRRSRLPRPVHRGHRMASRLLSFSPISNQKTTRPKRMMPRILSPPSYRNAAATHDRDDTFTKRRSKTPLGKKCKWCGLNYFLKKIKVYGDWNRKQSVHRYV
ncbi:uncharacterized protein LOC118409238 [Branchiostoma floridae]|uniref:Uncharacterized protein LOC118409238 n=1 Tax=Branchiostoma floridae TaxID=7739 RepID=A0A9J7KLV8_BRAFL|nr:uncharacterized protein LOC118409238 [Branchiostoma floridae]